MFSKTARFKFGLWWRNKVFPLLGIICYCATFGTNSVFPQKVIVCLAFFLCWATFIGSFGHFVNDCFDIDCDLRAGKKNLAASLSYQSRILISAALLVAGWLPWLYLPANRINISLLAVHCLLLALYAIPPFRLKERGILAWFTDAAYAFILPALITLFTFSKLFNTQWPVQAEFLTALLILWTLLYGLRSIIEHQIQDCDNDSIANINTWVTKNGPDNARKITLFLLPVEIALFTILLLVMSPWALFFCAVLLFNYQNGRYRYNPDGLRKSIFYPHTFLSTLYDTIFPVSLFLLFILLNRGVPLPLLVMPALVTDFHRLRVHRDFGLLFTGLFAAVYIPFLVNVVLPPCWVTVAVVTAAICWQCIYDLLLSVQTRPAKTVLLTTFALWLLTGGVLFYVLMNTGFWQQQVINPFWKQIALPAAIWGWLGCWYFREVWYLQLCKSYPRLETMPPHKLFLPVVASRIALLFEMLFFVVVCSILYYFFTPLVLVVFAAVSGFKIVYFAYAGAVSANTAINVRVKINSLNPFKLNPLRNVQIFGFVFMGQFYNKWLPVIIFSEIFAAFKLNVYLWILILPLLGNITSDVIFSSNIVNYDKDEKN